MVQLGQLVQIESGNFINDDSRIQDLMENSILGQKLRDAILSIACTAGGDIKLVKKFDGRLTALGIESEYEFKKPVPHKLNTGSLALRKKINNTRKRSVYFEQAL